LTDSGARRGSGRWLESEPEVELPRFLVLIVGHDELPNDADLERRAIAPVMGAPLEQEHVSVLVEWHPSARSSA
jgi:hypothetical protein